MTTKEYKVINYYHRNSDSKQFLEEFLNSGWVIERADIMREHSQIVYILSKDKTV